MLLFKRFIKDEDVKLLLQLLFLLRAVGQVILYVNEAFCRHTTSLRLLALMCRVRARRQTRRSHGLRPAQNEAGIRGEQPWEDLLHPEETTGGDQSGRGLYLPLPGLPHRQRR